MFKFSIVREKLLNALLPLSGAVEKKSTLPVLSNVLFDVHEDGIYLSSTDTEIELKCRISDVNVELPGQTTIPAKKLIDISRSLNDSETIKISQKQDKVQISAGRSRFNLSTLPAEDYPAVDDEVPELEFQIERNALIDVIQVSHFAMANQDVRFYLNGLLIEVVGNHLFSVSTDGHRLALSKAVLESEIPSHKMILPRKGVLEMLRLLNDVEDEFVLIQQSKNHVHFKTKSYQFTSKVVLGKFPNYRRVIPVDNDKHVVIDRDVLKKTLGRVSILANEKYRAVTLAVTNCTLQINAINQEQEEAVEELEVDTQGDPISIGVNANYIIDVLNNIPPGLVKIYLSEPNKSILLESSALPLAQYVVMPVKI